MQIEKMMAVDRNGAALADARLALGRGEVARALGTSVGFVDLEIRRGRLKAVRRGRRVFVPTEALLEYLR